MRSVLRLVYQAHQQPPDKNRECLKEYWRLESSVTGAWAERVPQISS
jgi:hypothetical protein